MKEFKLRASYAGSLWSASGKLIDGNKTFLQEWVKEQIYGVRKQIKSKYLEKGTQMEAEAIDKAIEWMNLEFVLKNDKNFEDEFFTGTPDIIGDDFIIDTKCSWDCFSFPLFDTAIENKAYELQLQIYMHLTGKKKAYLVYMLLNTPEFLTWEVPADYEGLDPKFRHKAFEITYNPEIISDLQKKVIAAREYINTLIK
jgi:hypothetical protein